MESFCTRSEVKKEIEKVQLEMVPFVLDEAQQTADQMIKSAIKKANKKLSTDILTKVNETVS